MVECLFCLEEIDGGVRYEYDFGCECECVSHWECMEKWLDVSVSCPICRRKVRVVREVEVMRGVNDDIYYYYYPFVLIIAMFVFLIILIFFWAYR